MRINCHVPVTVRVAGEPTPEQSRRLGDALARTVAARLAQAERIVRERHGGDGTLGAPPAPVRERYERDRDALDYGFAPVPGYDDDGRPIRVPVRGGARVEPRFEDRLLIEASVHLKINKRRDLDLLRRVVNWYADTTNYAAFLEAVRRDGLEPFFRGAVPVAAQRPTPSAGLGADTIRLIYGPTTEEPDYFGSLTFEERRASIAVGDRTRLSTREYYQVVERPGDQANDRVFVRELSWEMTPQALHAFLVEMVGGPLTPFEERLVANWNSLRPAPQFDGPRIVAYYLQSGSSGLREHRIHDPEGTVVASWTSEAALVNEGLGLIDYLLIAKGAVALGGLVIRAGVRLLASEATKSLARNILLSLRLTTRRLGRPLGAALEGADAGLGVPGIGAGRPTPALVVRESSAIAREAPQASPSAAAAREVPRVTAVTTVDQAGVRRVTNAATTTAPTTAPTAVGRAVEESWRQTFDLSPSTAAVAPGQGVVTTSPEVAAGFTPAQVTALRRILAKRFDHGDIGVLQREWDAAARPGDAAILNAGNSRSLFDLHRRRFWRRVAANPAARALFTDAGMTVSGGAPFLTVNGRQIILTIDHIVERQTAPRLALTASNLRLAFSRENSVVLRLLNRLDPFQ